MIQGARQWLISGVLAALAMLVAGCSSASTETSGDAPTYHRDVKPIVDASCGRCHAEGGIAPFALTTYAEVSAHKDAIKSATASGLMPPWPPGMGCTDYVDDRSLTDRQIATLGEWADRGAPEGDPGSAPAPSGGSTPGDELSRVDRTLELPVAYTPKVSPDEYRCFLVDWPEQATKYVTGFGVEPEARSIVHHVIVFHATPDKVAAYEALDGADADPGWTCFGGPGGDSESTRIGWIGGWVPGGRGGDFPAGTGIEMEPGSKLVVQVHYNTSSAPPAADRTRILLKLDDAVEKKASVMPYANPDWIKKHTMNIPAHAMDVTQSFSLDPTPYMGLLTGGAVASNQPFTIHGAGLHMHTRGTRARTKIQRAGGAEACLLDIERWSFHWQGNYSFAAAKTFAPGDQLDLECHFDNPDPNDVNWGETTADEMCLAYFYVTQ